MNPTPGPLHLLVLAFAGYLNRHQAAAVRDLREENRVLRELNSERRLAFTDDHRRRLAVRGAELGRAFLREIATVVTADTILRWHRTLVARKWTTATNGSQGRPGLMRSIGELIVRFAKENPLWGYKRIQGALKNVGHRVAWNTVKRVLKDSGIEPAPDRRKRTPWGTFLRAHWDSIAAADFFTTEVWTPRGLVTHYTLFVIDLATRAVRIVGTTPNPGATFMDQAAKILTDVTDGFLRTKRFIILDRDAIFSPGFMKALADEGITAVRTPVQAPDCNAYAERFVRSIEHECLNRIVFFGISSLDRALSEYVAHYNSERNHQGIGNALIAPEAAVGDIYGRVVRHERLGGMLNYYSRSAA